jgi:UDP-N-acetylmuramoyl-L-alanyl-D-glutamate--2,6-diaminopimelate ligase
MMPAEKNLHLVSLRYLLQGKQNIKNDVLVGAPSVDARNVDLNGVFLAISGSDSHGLMYANQAIARGAKAIVYDPSSGGEFLAEKIKKQHDICLIEVCDLNANASEIAARFYNNPSSSLSVIGITGTNGKTSISHFIAQALSATKNSCGVIGTLGWGSVAKLHPSMNTTPDAVSVQSQLATLVNEGFGAVAMEVSSHGLEQNRVKAVAFKGAVFTNLTHDHLDYHQTMEAYGQAKITLFKNASLDFVVLNTDDDFSQTIIDVLAPTIKLFSFSRSAKQNLVRSARELIISNEKLTPAGLSFDVTFEAKTVTVRSALFGAFNVDNIVATMAVLIAMGATLEESAARAQQLKSVAGRMQTIAKDPTAPTVIIDYAHTPDALKLALRSLHAHAEGKIKLIFGCGGNRDAAKRPVMGAIAAEWADDVIITNDNPRLESAEKIAEQIKSGAPNANHLTIELDRQRAIEHTIAGASASDIILVAGKGHEEYQQIGEEKISFSDLVEARNALERRALAGAGKSGCES